VTEIGVNVTKSAITLQAGKGWTTVRRILIAVDESEASRRAASFVEGFFHTDDVQITAVNVARVPTEWLPPAPYGGVYAWPSAPTADRTDVEEALTREQERGEAVASAQAPRGADVEAVFGETVEAITRAAEDVNADLIVVGSNDKGFLERLFSGSVSEKLARQAPCPVLVVP
jgi:nucleotide-binding universal stress UspA family protein